jgi:vancomycin resistance protein YoaR
MLNSKKANSEKSIILREKGYRKSGFWFWLSRLERFLRVFTATLTIILFLIIIIFYILNHLYQGKVLPEYTFLGKNLGLIDKGLVNDFLMKSKDQITEVVFYSPQFKNLPEIFQKIDISQDVFMTDLGEDRLKEITWYGKWWESYKIIKSLLTKETDISDEILVVDTRKIVEKYFLKNKNVVRVGEGNAEILFADGKLSTKPSLPEAQIQQSEINVGLKKSFESGSYKSPMVYVALGDAFILEADWERQFPLIQKMLDLQMQIFLQYRFGNASINESIGTVILPKIITLDKDKHLVFDSEKIFDYLNTTKLANYEIPPTEPEFLYNNEVSKVLMIKKEAPGRRFNTDLLAKQMTEKIFNSNKNFEPGYYFSLGATEWLPEHKLVDINPYGISEIVGTGYSSMKNSAPARFANIQNAIFKLNGVLIAPGQEFSTINALAPFTESNGYVEGLAIKGKKIVPEIGGGMCQVSTTLFRAAMNSGLEITDRSNHSIVVDYYNDIRNGLPGTDATIFYPAPDFKFRNDTKDYILIKTRVSANGDIYFDFWGKSDGRIGSFTAPQVFATKASVGEPVYDLTTSLPTGKVSCSGPFKGVSSVFTYVRKLSNGETKVMPYYSYYRPQPMNCLVGI